MATMGLPKSPLRMPVARHNEREAAAMGPLVVVSERKGLINVFSLVVFASLHKWTEHWNRNTHCPRKLRGFV